MLQLLFPRAEPVRYILKRFDVVLEKAIKKCSLSL